MKTKTSELEGAALDYAVAAATGVHDDGEHALMEIGLGRYLPSTDWSQGGPLIEKRQVSIEHEPGMYEPWSAERRQCDSGCGTGRTPLVAAMRAIVASEIGEEIDIPDELLEEA